MSQAPLVDLPPLSRTVPLPPPASAETTPNHSLYGRQTVTIWDAESERPMTVTLRLLSIRQLREFYDLCQQAEQGTPSQQIDAQRKALAMAVVEPKDAMDRTTADGVADLFAKVVGMQNPFVGRAATRMRDAAQGFSKR